MALTNNDDFLFSFHLHGLQMGFLVNIIRSKSSILWSTTTTNNNNNDNDNDNDTSSSSSSSSLLLDGEFDVPKQIGEKCSILWGEIPLI